MPVEKIKDEIYVTYKQVFDQEVHTTEYAIDHSDSELFEHTIMLDPPTIWGWKEMLEYCIIHDNINMFRYIIKKLEKNDNDHKSDIMSRVIQILRLESDIKTSKINEYLDEFC